jgi:hypothetical protein
VLFFLSLSLSLSLKQRTRTYRLTEQWTNSSYIVPKNPLPVLIRTNCIVKELTVNWWWFCSGSLSWKPLILWNIQNPQQTRWYLYF